MNCSWTVLSLVAVAVLGACGGGDDEGDSCGDATCGGNLVGAWHSTAVCVQGDLKAIAPTPADLPKECSDFAKGVELGAVDVTTTYGEDMSYSAMGTVDVSVQYPGHPHAVVS